MDLNSCLYLADVMHARISPVPNRFRYRIFNAYLDLSELSSLSKQIPFFSYNRWNLFSFWDKDHLQFGCKDTLSNVKAYVKASGVTQEIQKVYLLTNLRVLGYVFNPVSFYFCYDEQGKLVTALVEVGNTFGEIKTYLGFPKNDAKGDLVDPQVYIREQKDFYVSPFLPLDSEFEFRLNSPKERLCIGVDSFLSGKKVLVTTFLGEKKPFRSFELAKLFIRIPLVTVQIIVLIHWQAFKLWKKNVPFIKKLENLEKQTGVPLGQISEPIRITKND